MTHLERHFVTFFMKTVNKKPRNDTGADDCGEARPRSFVFFANFSKMGCISAKSTLISVWNNKVLDKSQYDHEECFNMSSKKS